MRFFLIAVVASTVLGYSVDGRACTLTEEICADGVDDNCNGQTDEATCFPKEICCNGKDDDNDGRVDEWCGACVTPSNAVGRGVSGASRQAREGPYVLAHIASDQGGSADITFAAYFDSARAEADANDNTATTCTVNGDCGEGRNCNSGTHTCDASTGAVNELPYTRVLGQGFRHTYDDRLILDKNHAGTVQIVTWEHIGISEAFTLYSGNVWHSEPGTHEILEQSGSTWRLLTANGDLLEFVVPATASVLHPAGVTDQTVASGALSTTSTHARLQKIFPGASPNRWIRLLYEGDATGTGPEQVPTAVCSGMPAFGGNPAGSCYAARGLLVKIGTVFLETTTQHGPSIELAYTFVAHGTDQRDQYLISKVNNGTDRVDGHTVQTMAQVIFDSAQPDRVRNFANMLHCKATATSNQCMIAYFTWATGVPWKMTTVSRPIVDSSGNATLVPEVKLTWDANKLVSAETAPGLSIASTSTPWTSPMTWTINGVTNTISLDGNGNPTDCSTGSCGVNVTYKTTSSGYTLGPSAVLGVDESVWHAYDYADPATTETRGPVLACDLVTNTTFGSPPSCTLSGDVATWTSGTYPRRIERRYYDSLGRLRATAVYDVDSPLTSASSVTFPHQATADTVPFTSSNTITGGCPTMTTSFSGGYFDVTNVDYDSDGDGTTAGDINEGTSATSLFATTGLDMHVTRITRAAQSSTYTPQLTQCTVLERLADANGHNGRGDITKIRSYEGSTQTALTDLTNVFAVASGNTNLNDRVQYVKRYRTPTSSTDWEYYWQGCNSTAYDDEGRAVCFFIPQVNGGGVGDVPISVTLTAGGQTSTDPFGYRWVTKVFDTKSGNNKYTFAEYLGWGAVHRKGIGDGTSSGGPTPGNYVVYLRDGSTTDATRATRMGTVAHYDSSGALLYKTVNDVRDSYGRVTESEVLNGTGVGTLRKLRDRTIDPGGIGQDRASQDNDEIDTTPTYATTSYAYQSNNWDALYSTTEADGDVECYAYGTTGSEASRLSTISRGVDCTGPVQQKFTHTQDGLLYQNFNVPYSATSPAAYYAYDSLRRVKQEVRQSAGQLVDEYPSGLAFRKIVENWSAAVQSDVTTLYDGLGRPLSVTDNHLSPGTVIRLYKWDEKALGTSWDSCAPSDFNRGHLAYVQDLDGTTFYNYDAQGRVVAVGRLDGTIGSACTNVTWINYAYNANGSQELTSITYPAHGGTSLVVTYNYNNGVAGGDRARPTGLTTMNGGGLSISGAKYEPSGRASDWNWQSSTSNPRAVTRDLLGRPTEMKDTYASSVWGDVTYSYDGDGDPVSESDSLGYTWLVHDATSGHSRSYDYSSATNGANKDILNSWVDDGTTEAVSSFTTDGRRSIDNSGGTYAYNPTYWERATGRTGGTVSASIDYGTTDLGGSINSITWSGGMSGTTAFTYDAELATATVNTTAQGTFTSSYDAHHRRVKLVDASGNTIRFRYGPRGRLPLEEYRTIGRTITNQFDTVFFAGEPVAQVVTTTNPTGGPTAYHLHTDRMKMVRKISSTTGAHFARIISDAFGASNYAGSDYIADDNVTLPQPSWNWRYPGQYVDAGGAYNNGWREYIPELGQFNAVDPIHAQTASAAYGPQSYAYADGRPFVNVDADGLCPACVVAVAVAIGEVCTADEEGCEGVADAVAVDTYEALTAAGDAEMAAAQNGTQTLSEALGTLAQAIGNAMSGLMDGVGWVLDQAFGSGQTTTDNQQTSGQPPAEGEGPNPPNPGGGPDGKKPGPECDPCPAPPPPRIDNTPGQHGCTGGHKHTFTYNQNPQTCECFCCTDTVTCL